MPVVSINSHVVYGHVGAQAAVLPLQRLGHEVRHLPTVLFSNHPGHGGFRGQPVSPALLRELVIGMDERGFLADAAALHSGYLGAPGTGEVVLEALARMRKARAGVLYCCDPVLGDEDGVYVDRAIVGLMRDRLIPAADIATPNRFELSLLTGRTIGTIAHAAEACATLRASGLEVAVCTSAEITADRIVTVAAARDGTYAVETPCFADAPHGTGDAFAAIFLGRYLTRRDAAEALALAASAVCGIVEASVAAGSDELLMVAMQEEVVRPTKRSMPQRLS